MQEAATVEGLHVPEAMDGYRQRAEAHAAMARAQQMLDLARERRDAAMIARPRRGHRMTRDLTAAQLHKRALAGADLDLGKRIEESGLWTGIPLSRKSWCARLRELELHPERLEAIRDRITVGQRARKAAADAAAA